MDEHTYICGVLRQPRNLYLICARSPTRSGQACAKQALRIQDFSTDRCTQPSWIETSARTPSNVATLSSLVRFAESRPALAGGRGTAPEHGESRGSRRLLSLDFRAGGRACATPSTRSKQVLNRGSYFLRFLHCAPGRAAPCVRECSVNTIHPLREIWGRLACLVK